MFDLPLLLFVEDLAHHDGVPREQTIAELEAAGLRAAVKALGDRFDLEVRFNEDADQLDVFVAYKVVERASDSARELTVRAAEAAGLFCEVDDELLFEIGYRWQRWDNQFTSPMPIAAPRWSIALGEAMLDELLGVFARHHAWYLATPMTLPAGSVGHALATTAGWLRGYTQDGVTIERTFLRVYSEFVAAASFHVYWGAELRCGDRTQVVWTDQQIDADELLSPFTAVPTPAFTRAYRNTCGELDGVRPGVQLTNDDEWLQVLAAGPPPSSLVSLHFRRFRVAD